MPHAKRFSRRDWLDAGLAALRQHGQEGLYIGGLTGRQGKTTGAFYAHFSSMEAYVLALARHWRDGVAAAMAGSRTRIRTNGSLAVFDHEALRLDGRIEQYLRHVAAGNPEIAEICRTVDQSRIDYLAHAHAGPGRPPGEAAREIARLEYAALIGLQQVGEDTPADEAGRLHDLFLAMGRARPAAAQPPTAC